MPNTTKLIRDFIYIDVERLYSLYSQINEGVADQIYKLWTSEGANRDVQGGRFGTRKSSEEVATETVQETSSIILHDYLYNKLEESLSGAILKPEGVTADNWQDAFSEAFLIKVEGKAELNDYQHLIHATLNLTDITAEVAYVPRIALIQQEIIDQKKLVANLEQQAKTLTGNEKTKLNIQITQTKNQIAILSDRDSVKKMLLAEQGLDIEEQTTGVAKILNYFSPESFEVTIVPSKGAEGVVFRGILDRKLLRLQPEYLRQLYKGALARNWTMVGEITHLPDQHSSLDPSSSTQEDEGGNRGMKEAIRIVISHISDMEDALHETNKRVEVRVRPLAIYQEVAINVPTPAAE